MIRRFGLYLVSLIALPGLASAASLTTETFSASMGGWQDRDPGKMTVTHVLTGGNPGGCLRGMFDQQVGPPQPQEDAFIATGNLASASFTGDYHSAEAWMLGFDFLAITTTNNAVISNVVVLLYSATNIIVRNITNPISTTGVWHTLRLPLLSADLGGWVGDKQYFSALLSQVSKVEIRLARIGEGVQFYYLDNIFLDRVPEAVAVTEQEMVWQHIRSGTTYRVEAATNLQGSGWELVNSFTATSSMYQASISTNLDARNFRLTIP